MRCLCLVSVRRIPSDRYVHGLQFLELMHWCLQVQLHTQVPLKSDGTESPILEEQESANSEKPKQLIKYGELVILGKSDEPLSVIFRSVAFCIF
ncbi:hypothetical protein NQ317_007386 [Molorchus minor]|uniref:Uncharacterized protein n=1 Tax=Molorchus minor TaxID=1323400 RepID=A0ABQ9JWY0_9CUCU|nr:hypothetical protein NQ317_007386 [Molorchus minor]